MKIQNTKYTHKPWTNLILFIDFVLEWRAFDMNIVIYVYDVFAKNILNFFLYFYKSWEIPLDILFTWYNETNDQLYSPSTVVDKWN